MLFSTAQIADKDSGRLQAEAPALQGPAKTHMLLVCMDSQHILKKNTWQQRNAWCLTPWWGSNSPGVVGSAAVCDGRVSFCAKSNPAPPSLLPCELLQASTATVIVNVNWLLCLVISEHRQLQTTGAHKGGVNKPLISPVLKNYTYTIMLERKEASGQNKLGS